MNLTRQVNFTSFTRSFLLLLQTMTGMPTFLQLTG